MLRFLIYNDYKSKFKIIDSLYMQKFFSTIFQNNPSNELLTQGEEFKRKNDKSKAIDCYEQALILNNHNAVKPLLDLYRHETVKKPTKKILDQCLTLASIINDPEVFHNIGFNFELLNNENSLDKAIICYEQSINLQKKNTVLLTDYLLLDCYVKKIKDISQENKTELEEIKNLLIKLFPLNPLKNLSKQDKEMIFPQYYQLALKFLEKPNFNKNADNARQLLHIALQLNQNEALNKLIHIYAYHHKQLSSSLTEDEAEKFFKLAKKLPSEVTYEIGLIFHYGCGINKDADKAKTCFSMSAGHKNPNALYILGTIHEKNQDIDLAKNFYTDAKESGHPDAQKSLEEIQTIEIIQSNKNNQSSQKKNPSDFFKTETLKDEKLGIELEDIEESNKRKTESPSNQTNLVLQQHSKKENKTKAGELGIELPDIIQSITSPEFK